MNTPPDRQSPYAPPSAEVSQPPAALPSLKPNERSGAPKVFGVLSIIFASVMILFSSMGLLALAASPATKNIGMTVRDADKAAEVEMLMKPVARLSEGVGLQSLIFFVMSAVLLAIGIGQLRYRAWAQRWSVTWGVAGLVCVALLVAISLLVVAPAYREMLEATARLKPRPGQAPMPDLGSLSGLVGISFAVVTVIFYAPYPAMMWLFFTRDHVRASMTR